jgi:hypothetical protein
MVSRSLPRSCRMEAEFSAILTTALVVTPEGKLAEECD